MTNYEWLKERLFFKLEIAKSQMESSNERERSYYAGRYEALKQLKEEVEKRRADMRDKE